MRSQSSPRLFILITVAMGLFLQATISLAATEKVIYTFTGQSGWGPISKLVMDSSGRLFGATQHGGSADDGTVFELTAPDSRGMRSYIELYAFQGGNDGILPIGDIVMDAAGNLYGVTTAGGANSDGIVYCLSPSISGQWTETILHTFNVTSDGANASAGLAMDSAGNLYGTMSEGGVHNSGTIYMLTKNSDGSWSESIRSNLGDGAANPTAEVIIDSEGNIFGIGVDGGEFGWGTVFELSGKSGRGKAKILFNLPNQYVGYPEGQLWRDPAGNLYGTAYGYSVYYSGAVYELSHNADGSWTENTLHIFGQQPFDGYQPECGLTPDSEGNLYGTTPVGGQYGLGTVYKLARGSNGTWTYSIVYNFGANANDASFPISELTVGPGNTLYGATYGGGPHNWGTVYEIKP
jgi:uncharacterized repeat protein (TIGR03803 family)